MVSFTAMQKETLTQKPLVVNVHNYTEYYIFACHNSICSNCCNDCVQTGFPDHSPKHIVPPPNWLNDWLYLLVGILKQKESGFHSTTELKKYDTHGIIGSQ